MSHGREEGVAELLRRVYPQVLATVLGFTSNVPEAEDAVQEAVVRALAHWPERGRPDKPTAWLITVAKNTHRDRKRKTQREVGEPDALAVLAEMSPWVQMAMADPEVGRGWKDELLRVVFACCHPALEPGESAALCLSTVVGLSVSEVAQAFLVEPRTMEQRLSRARRRLRERGSPESVPPERSRERIEAVLRVVHLLFNEGYWSSQEGAPIRVEVCRLAVGLAHSLTDAFPEHAEARGLLALLMLHEARREARAGSDGETRTMVEQDRGKWDHLAIERALALLAEAARAGRPGPYQIEAAISAAHCSAARAEETPWREIAALYERLEQWRPTPAVRVNRAFAAGRAHGPDAGLSLLDQRVADYPYVHLVRGTLLAEAGQLEEARRALRLAEAAARNDAEREAIEARLATL